MKFPQLDRVRGANTLTKTSSGRINRMQGGRLATIVGILILSLTAHAAQRPEDILADVGITPQLNERVPLELHFNNHRAETVTLESVVGDRPLVLCLVYFECPMLCQMTADGLIHGLREIDATVGRDFDVLMLSFDRRESSQQAAAARATALQRYGREGADRGWHTWTGDADAIEKLTDAVGFRYRWDPELKQYAHAAGLVVLTPQGRISGYLDGVRFPPRELATAIEQANAGEIAAAGPTNFLRCYLYDPTTGKFGAAVQWTVRVLGVITVLGLMGFIGLMKHRELRTADEPSE